MRHWLVLIVIVVVLLPGLVFTEEQTPTADSTAPSERIRAMYEEIRQHKLREVPDLEPREAMDLADSVELWIVDVRNERERQISVLPNSVPIEQFRQRYDSAAPRPVLVYCTIGQRSGNFTRELRAKGVEAYNLAGGILLWVAEGGFVLDESSGEPTRRVHVYGSRWNVLPEGYEGVW